MAIDLSDTCIRLGADDFEVKIRRSSRARRMRLRVDARLGGVELVLPASVSREKGLAFLKSELGWVRERLAALPRPVPFAAGAEIPYLGEPHVIRHCSERARGPRRGVVWRAQGAQGWELHVRGEAAHLSRRLGDWLRRQAKAEIAARAMGHAAVLGVQYRRITVRDTKSRWGSCSPDGGLNFSWRLILAPEEVLDYVIAHEVSHLREMNHSPRFWATVAEICPRMEGPKAWLKTNGGALHRYG